MQKLKLAYIIDDDEVIIFLTNSLIRRVEFAEKVKTFTNAESALEKLKEAIATGIDIPDVILFDLNMPVVNGWDFIEEFHRMNLGIPTFIFTSSIDPADKEKSYGYEEIKAFITKPLTEQKINKIIRLTQSQ